MQQLKQPAHKIFSLAVKGYENIFGQHTAGNFPAQPISGCFILVNQ